MELTPQQLTDVEFSEQWRGYNRDQVDDFIERVAQAVSTLQERLKKMTERAVRAEQRAKGGSESDVAARRALVLAQRTADATVAEAKDTAARIVAQAQEEARAILLAAEAANETLPAAEPTARAQIVDLEVTRSRLQADVAALEAHVTERRVRIKDLLDELQRRVDDGFQGQIVHWQSDGDDDVDGEFDDEFVDDTTVEPDVDTERVSFDAPGANVDAPSADLTPAPSLSEPPDEALTASDVDEPEEDLAADEPLPDFSALSERDVDDDTFFAHLRGELDHDAPLGPREDAHGLARSREEAATAVAEAPRLYDQADSEGRKFGRRKRRQRRQD